MIRTHPPEVARLIEAAEAILEWRRINDPLRWNLIAALAAIKGTDNAQG